MISKKWLLGQDLGQTIKKLKFSLRAYNKNNSKSVCKPAI